MLQSCICGWSKITTARGLKIHQGKKKCLSELSKGSRIDQYLLRTRSSQSSEALRQENPHRPQDINTSNEAQSRIDPPTVSNLEPSQPAAVSSSESIQPAAVSSPEPSQLAEVSTPDLNQSATGSNTEHNQPLPAKERKMEGRKPLILWPKSNQKREWETINSDLVLLLEQQKGPVERKLDNMGAVIYSYGAERFGVKSKAQRQQKGPPNQSKSRRQREIESLVKERRQLRKLWRKATEMEREGIEVLQAEIKQRLTKLRRAEHLRRQRKRKERTRTLFFSNPYSFVKGLFDQEKSGSLKVPIKDLEEHLSKTYADDRKHEPVTIPNDMPPIHAPEHQMDVRPPTWSEVEKTVKQARSASAPGPNGIPYRLYKNAPGALRYLWKLMKVAWRKGVIPRAWRRAGGILIPKEKDSSSIGQFRQISLLNVEGKMFFSVIAQRLSAFLQRNNFVDTSVQKAGIQGFSGCLEHANMIWHQIQAAKKERRDLHVVFLDLANVFGSVPHKTLWTAFKYFDVPGHITELVKSYFQDLQFCVTSEGNTTAWQHLEVGIMAGCTISPLAFVMAMELVIRASRWVVGGERTKSGLRLPPIRAYMDDMTVVTTTKPCTRRLLQKLQENIQWARMEFKPSKSRSISIVKGQLTGERFHISGEPIPTLLEKPIKSLGRWYNADLRDNQQIEQLQQDTANGLRQINNTALPGKLKLWCLQFGLFPRLQWTLTMYEVSICHATRLERLVNSHARKWLGLPRCFSSVGLYSDGALSLPISSVVEEFKCAKVRLEMSLTDSRDPVVRGAPPTLATGRKWTPATAVLQAKSALLHRDVVGHVQQGRAGIGLGTVTPLWRKASTAERRTMVVEEVRRQEEATRRSKAVAQAKQGRWMRWEGVEKKKLSWSELWGMESNRLSFIIRATYDVLQSPINLQQWFGKDPACPLCTTPATLKHIMVGCKTSLTQGRYTWRHNQVLRCLADKLECKRASINALPTNNQDVRQHPPLFVREGEKQRARASHSDPGPLNVARDWQLQAHLDRRLTFPPEIATTNLRPDLVLWSNTGKLVYIIELTVPWEDAVEEAYERKKLRYSNLAAEAEDRGWKVRVRPVEVGCRGFVASSTAKLLREVGIRGHTHRQAIKELANTAERTSHWLWMKRSDTIWAAKPKA